MTVFYEVMGYRDIDQRYKYMLENMVLDRSIHENTRWFNVISSSHAKLILELFLRLEIAMDSRWGLAYFDHFPNVFRN